MINKTLVTTALESTWPKEGPVLFLGSWCCSFSRRDLWQSLDFEITSYHWDDRKKLRKDYKNLELIYERFLVALAEELNQIHGTKFSNKFWRILIGPWLYTCIQVVFDRWHMLKKAIRNEDLMNFYSLENHIPLLITDDIDAFNIALETDEWNEALYSTLVEKFFNSEVSIQYIKKASNEKDTKTNKEIWNFKSGIVKVCNAVSRIFTRNKDIFIIAPHMSFFRQILLHIKLRQFPVFWFREDKESSYQDPTAIRFQRTLSCRIGVLPEFEAVLKDTLFSLIPRVYLEGFNSLLRKTNLQGWPKNPKAIFTSNSYASDELFKCWAGSQVDSGSKLIIGQHGGNFGMTPMAIHESHQIKISDKWLSWGWRDQNQPKIVPIGNFKTKTTRSKHQLNGDALLVTMTLPKFSYYLYSVPIAGQVESYLDDQFEFAKALPEYIRQKLRVRLYPLDRDWDQKARWQEQVKQVSYDSNNRSLLDSLKTCRVFIGTYNATTFLETFARNMPSILYWNPKHWEVNANTETQFEKLRSVGVLHSSPVSAAMHLKKVWDDVDEWWFSAEVQKVIADFNNLYVMRNPNMLNSITKLLTA